MRGNPPVNVQKRGEEMRPVYLPGLAKEPLTYQRRPQSESDSSWRWTNPGPLQRDEIWILKSKTLRHCNANEIITQCLSGNRGTAAFLLNREIPGLRVRNIVPPEALTVNFTDKELVKVKSGSGLLPHVGTWAHPKGAIFYAAGLTGKLHKNVRVDIRKTLTELGYQPAEYSARYTDAACWRR